ncbi:hypothetical protein Taro_029399 [Colocasia esculenta]|uniref:Uncharacterized protein n=1 Tax=Colocasia esculenta TaxID=4460 RepID=A0A843VUS6_COLES|nr:hypothetical protein [Colocasia esculenta]
MRGAGSRASSSASAAAVYTSLNFAVRARSVLGVRRSNQVVSMENAHERELHGLDHFQVHVADRLRSLTSDGPCDKYEGSAGGGDRPQKQGRRPVVSLPFMQKLLDAFVCIEEEFKALLLPLLDRDPTLVSRPPLDRLVADLLDRTVKSLDVCNAVTQALDSLHLCEKHATIAAAALQPPPATAGEPFVGAQFQRARRASSKLLAFLALDHKPHGVTTERAWSFGLSSRGAGAVAGGSGSGSSPAVGYVRRCLTLDVSRNWSGAKQMQSMWTSLSPPRGADATALAMALYTMIAVIVFVMWTLVVAFPCQERGGHGSSALPISAFSFPAPPRQLPWAAPMVALQEAIADDWRRDRKNSSGPTQSPGLLAELQSMVRCGRALVDLGDGAPAFPLNEQQQEEVASAWSELAATCRSIEEELGPLQQRVREVFHRIVLSRAEILHCLSHGDRPPSPAAL